MKISGIKFPILIYILIASFLFGCARGPVQQRLLKSMVEFDRLYVPSLIFTNLNKQRESEIAVERLKREWDKFNRKYYNLEIKYGMDITDKFWKEDFTEINELISSAESLVKEENLAEAYKKLRAVRITFKNIRHRNGLVYFLDGMTGFHDSMEEIILSLRGKDKLSDKDIDKLRTLFKVAQASWNEMAGTEIDLDLFGFNAEKVEAIKKRVQDEEMMLASLAAALSSKDADRIFQAAQDLKPNFIVLYKAFGDFQPVFDQVVKERDSSSAKVSRDKEKEEKNDEIGSE